MTALTHIGASGEAHMVDVGAKPATERVAVAAGKVAMARGNPGARALAATPRRAT